jgi:hypothetical protein
MSFSIRIAGFCCIAIFTLLDGRLTAQTQTHRRKLTTDIKEIVLENRLLSRKFALDNGWLRTAHFGNLTTGENIVASSPEFQIQFENEPLLSSDDFVAEYYTPIVLAGEVKRSVFSLTDKRQRIRLELEYTLGPNDFFMRKRVRLYALQRNLPRLLSVSVEAVKINNVRTTWPHRASSSSTTATASLQEPFGQPVFVNDSFFWGMEHPMGTNRLVDGVVTCVEYPGTRFSSEFESHTAIAGISPKGDVAEWFLRYIDTIRLPTRPLTILRIPADRLDSASLPELLRQSVEAIPKNLGQTGHSLVDALLLDSGSWQAGSAHSTSAAVSFPQNLDSASQMLKSKGSGLGLCLSLTGADTARENASSQLAAAVPKKSVHCLLNDAAFRDELKGRLKEFHQRNSLRFVRHDSGEMTCAAEGQDSPVEALILRQAAADHFIELMRLERSWNSDLYISLMEKRAPSPWWLQYVNDVGPGEGLHDYLRQDLSPRPRDWQIYSEALFLQHYFGAENFQFPLSRLVASDLKCSSEGAAEIEEPEHVWADAVAEYLGRGQDLTELNFPPERLDQRAWEILRRGLEWKASRQSVFHRGSRIGGFLEQAEPYGYLHWNSTQAIAVLRNPSHSPYDTSFRLPRSLRGSIRVVETYPHCRIEGQLLKAGDIVNTSLEGLETRVLEINPEGTWNSSLPQDVDFIISSSVADDNSTGRLVVLKVFPETAEVRFTQAQPISDLRLSEHPIGLDSVGNVEPQDDPEWKNAFEALKLFTEQKAEVGVYAKRGVQLTLPGWHGVKSDLAIWLLHPKEPGGNFPLYVTLDRKQANLGNRQDFTAASATRAWGFYSVPLKFEHQVLLDWAIKDVKDVSLFLWWELEAPRPALEFKYHMPSGKSGNFPPPLLSSPHGDQYAVRIPLEVEKPRASGDTP